MTETQAEVSVLWARLWCHTCVISSTATAGARHRTLRIPLSRLPPNTPIIKSKIGRVTAGSAARVHQDDEQRWIP